MYDVLIIGGGVIGCAVAHRLSEYRGHMAVVEAGPDVCQGASRANSGIVHAGFDAVPGTEKARLNVKGARMMQALCNALGVPYGQPGAMVLGFSEDDRASLQTLYKRALQNEVSGCRLIEGREALTMEPQLNPAVVAALHVPASGLVSPYELTLALANAAARREVAFLLNTRVQSIKPVAGGWALHTNREILRTRAFVNCAGIFGGELHNQVSSRPVRIIARRGQYYLLDRAPVLPFGMTMFQVPTAMGKGVLVSPTTHGNLLIGPTAEDIPDMTDTATTASGLQEVLQKAALTWPAISVQDTITTFSGIRAHEAAGDFIIGAVEGAKEGAFEAIGIESPGLSAAPAIGQELGDWVAYAMQLVHKPTLTPLPPAPKFFRHMSNAEKQSACEKNSDYGHIVCRCEMVTEAEVRQAIRQPVGARNLDGVKLRTRAGMGRCQGGFCSPRILHILCEELGLAPEQVTKFGGASQILVGRLQDIAKEGLRHGQ
ncbi:MAG: NAD(P)/FAD-dependent oxidoreductase [Clostridiales bacterium]|nr:NAD(P)/FAD-dependent oxidoreductase [Clostridiales bacterium]